jgi:hypothetical protein
MRVGVSTLTAAAALALLTAIAVVATELTFKYRSEEALSLIALARRNEGRC